MNTLSRMVVVAVLLSVGAAIGLYAFQHRISSTWLSFSLHPDVRNAVSRSLEDQKRLAQLDPAHRDQYRGRFENLRRLETRLEVLALSRDSMTRRYDLILVGVFFAGVLIVSSWYLIERRREQRRLARIGGALDGLSGIEEVRVDETSADTVGRIARMIEATSKRMVRDHRRIESLRHLQVWQEAARRHAHEIRTPLTSLQLGVERLADAARSASPEPGAVDSLVESVRSELEALRRFTRQYSSFGTIAEPALRTLPVAPFLEEFCTTFREAWKGVGLECSTDSDAVAAFDPELIRRVLANLCANSARAMEENGTIRVSVGEENGMIAIEHRDDGRGIPAPILARLFEPYNTTSRPGEGMGLGLAIARKIMLDHHGDLELVSTSERCTTFRLLLPKPGGGE
ncbi:MAG: HAMP domain-containing sensor histidine kinase [Thermoanaerobaculia bacterium]